MKMKSALALLIAVCLMLVCFTGCGKNPDPTVPSDEATTATDPTTAETEAPTDPLDPTEPPETEPPTVMGTVTHNKLNVRSNPSTDSTVLSQLQKDARVEIIEQKVVGDVTWGRIPDGWVNMAYILLDGEDPVAPTEPEEDPQPTDGVAGTITAGSLHIREKNSTTAKSVGKYVKGDKVVILETKDGWGRTDKGWISLKYVKTEGAPETPDIKDEDKTDTTDKTDKDNKDDKEMSTLVTDGKTKVLGYVEIDTPALYVRYGPGTKYNVAGKVYEDERHAYYQEKWGWVRIKDGWISLAYTDQKDDDDKQEDDKKDEIVSDGKTTVLGYGVVTTGGLNVRTGPGTENKSIDEMELGDRVAYYQKEGKWIRTKDGWISTTYVYLEGEKGEGAGSGTVTGDKVNLRKGPGTGFDSNGKLNEGDKVEILRTLKIGKHTWGYTSNGWIRMDYVKMS